MKPMKLDENVTKIVSDALREGVPASFVHNCANISRRSYFNWRSQGESILERVCECEDGELDLTKKERMLLHFFTETEKAHSDYIQSLMKAFEKTTNSDWRAIAWVLERRYPKEFGRNRKCPEC